MLRIIARYGAPILLALAPLLTYQYSLLDLLGYEANLTTNHVVVDWSPIWKFDAVKPQVEMELRAAITLVGVLILVIGGYFDAYLPSRTLESVREAYLADTVKNQWRKRGRIKSSLRINVMYLKWRWYMPFGRSFKVVWKDKFHASDRDGSLRLYRWQGVCGQASRINDAVCVDFRVKPIELTTIRQKYFMRNRFHLCHWQLRKTRHLKTILSVPILDTRGKTGQETHHCVGVINIDAKTDADADYLEQNSKDLAVFLAKHGQLIAKMR